MLHLVALSLLSLTVGASALAWSSPHIYPGYPNSSDYKDPKAWQDYFLVTEPLPNITFPLQRSWAGSISTDTQDMQNNSLFFWAFEKENGSMTADSDKPWGLWLAGGPGYSSIAGLLLENGPIRMNATTLGFQYNEWSWSNLADWFWVDNPVGTGFATVGKGGYSANEDEVAENFMGFIRNLVDVFPNLKSRPLYIAGESYAGRYIPYIMKNYFGIAEEDRPIVIAKAALGNPGINSIGAFESAPITRALETYPQIINYDTETFEYFVEQAHLCKMDVNLTYPSKEHIPYVYEPEGGFGHEGLGGNVTVLPPDRRRSFPEFDLEDSPRNSVYRRTIVDQIDAVYQKNIKDLSPEERKANEENWKQTHLPPNRRTESLNPVIDSWYGCDLYHHVMYYAINYTYPWTDVGALNFLELPLAVNPVSTVLNPESWMNSDAMRDAIHAPHNMNWTTIRSVPWGNNASGEDGSPEPMFFFDELAWNMTKNGIGMLLYAGNDDLLAAHFGIEIVIQNTTIDGTIGFEKKPQTPWYDDQGEYAGIVHQERNWTYILVKGGGHQLPIYAPERSYEMVRDFFLGNATLGLYKKGEEETPGKVASADQLYSDGVVPGTVGIVYGTKTLVAPKETLSSWDHYIATKSLL